jgi:MinD-like ATPase involved in chromosome partitioning or flagellar assembly
MAAPEGVFMTDRTTKKTEILCVCSGKGGVGKTLFASCLGFALTRAGLRVLMIDGDLATDGLSLFLLGPDGKDNMGSFEPSNTLAGVISHYSATGKLKFGVRQVYRNGPHDHGVVYDALISGRYLYGQGFVTANQAESPPANVDQAAPTTALNAIPTVERRTFQSAVRQLFDALRSQGEYDYVVVDTRGGFSFESTDLCALGDSFLVVVEADPTSFYQTSNLVQRIDDAAGEAGSKSVLRGFLINKAVDGLAESGDLDLSKVEWSFRNALIRQFPILKYSDTYPVPADLQVLQSYKDQMVPLLASPASLFTYATLTAYSNIFQLVTSRWTKEQVQGWQSLVNSVAEAIRQRNEEAERRKRAQEAEEAEIKRLRETSAQSEQRIRDLQAQIEQLRKDVDLAHAQAAAELSRASAVENLVRTVTREGSPKKSRLGPGSILLWIFFSLVGVGGGLSELYFSAKQKAAKDLQAAQNQQQTLALQNQVAVLTAQLQAVTANSRSGSGAPEYGLNAAPSGPSAMTGKANAPGSSVEPIHVYLHMADSSQTTRAAEIQKILMASGVVVMGTDLKQYSGPLRVTEVHYFRDNPQSIADAERIQKILMQSGSPAIAKQTNDAEKLRPRTYGVWLASAPAGARGLSK